jgi:hypothetical protein
MKKLKDYDCENIAISIYHRLNSLYGLGMMLEENESNSNDITLNNCIMLGSTTNRRYKRLHPC